MNFQDLYNTETLKQFKKGNPEFLRNMLPMIKASAKQMRLTQYVDLFINSWDKEAHMNGWHAPQIQDVYAYVWDHYSKSMIKAPREHLKTTSVLEYIIKMLHTREYPLEINYYHHSVDMSIEKLRKMRRMIEANPLLFYGLGLNSAVSLKEDLIVLEDGSVVQPLSWKTGVVGKHPHIIIMDDVIDKHVIYSDEQNKKAIEKFYIDIVPMITKMTEVKKIISIGTSQRKDDLYSSLPSDFYRLVLQAIIDDDKRQTLAPDLYTYEDLMKVKESILSNPLEGGERFWLKEYMNVPFDRLGTIINSSNIHHYYSVPKDLLIYQGWDLSVAKDLEKSDFTVGATIGVEIGPLGVIKVYILDIHRARLSFDQRLEAVKDQYALWKATAVGVESVAFQYDTIQTLFQTTLIPIVEIKALKNKIESFQTELGPYFERAQVLIPEIGSKPWVKPLIEELLSLPTGSYDDQADAIKIAIKTALFNMVGAVRSSKEDQVEKDNSIAITSGLQSKVF